MKKLFIFFAFLILVGSCDTEYENPIGEYYVSMRLDLNFDDKVLKGIPSYKIYTKKNLNSYIRAVGLGGVLVVHTTDNLNPYVAFDMACPYEATGDAIIQVSDNMVEAVCNQCQRKYYIIDGSGVESNGKGSSLKRYRVVENNATLIVAN